MRRSWIGAGQRLLIRLLGARDGVMPAHVAVRELGALAQKLEPGVVRPQPQGVVEVGDGTTVLMQRVEGDGAVHVGMGEIWLEPDRAIVEIGRASCRERV